MIKDLPKDKDILETAERSLFSMQTQPDLGKRIIMHIDYDSFFASVEQQANPVLRNKPIGVTGGRSNGAIITAASIQAKKFGVKTGMPMFKAKEVCPQIIPVKGDFTKYAYIQKRSLKIFDKYADLVEPYSIDEAFIEVTGTVRRFNSPAEIAFKIKFDVKEAFGEVVTCSIGIGPNKMLAKLVSDFNKPNGLFIVDQNNVEAILKSVELQDFCGIGPRIEKRLNNLGIFTTKQLRKADLLALRGEFGRVWGTFLKNASFGIDNSPVTESGYKDAPKSFGHQHTLSKNTRNPKILLANLRRLTEMVCSRMREKDMMAKTIHIGLRDSNFRWESDRTTVKTYTDNTFEIYKQVEGLFKRLWGRKETRLVAVHVSNLTPKNLTMFSLFPEDQRKEKLIYAADKINNKFGDFTICTASSLTADQVKNKISSFLKG